MSDYDKRDLMILALEQDPYDDIVWVVYNEDMARGIRKRFIELRGEKFVHDHVQVVSPQTGYKAAGRVYFDPAFHDHLGNGSH